MDDFPDEIVPDRSIWHPGGRTGVLLIHGLGGTPIELALLARALAQAGCTVLCVQLAGHCSTPAALQRSTSCAWVESVGRAHDRLAASCDRIIVGGLSMGALLALDLALARPKQVAGLLLLAPTFRLDGWAMPVCARLLAWLRPWFLPFDAALAERFPYGLKDERIRAFVLKRMLTGATAEAGSFRTPLRALAQFNSLVHEVRPRLGEIRQPVLIVHPRHDDMAALDNAFLLQRWLGGPVEMRVLEDSYHLVTVDRQRHVVSEAAVRFVGRFRTSAPAVERTV